MSLSWLNMCSFLVQIPQHYTTTRWSSFPLYALFCIFLLIFDPFHKMHLIKHSMILLLEGECYLIHNWWTGDILNSSLKHFCFMTRWLMWLVINNVKTSLLLFFLFADVCTTKVLFNTLYFNIISLY